MNTFEIPTFRLDNKLTNEQISFFRQHGIIQFKKFIDKDLVGIFLKEVERVQSYLVENEIRKVNGIPLKYGRDFDGSPIVQRIAFTSYYSNTLRDFLKDERLRNLLLLLGDHKGRIGEHEKDGLVYNHYVNVEQSHFTQLGWHTDSPRDLFLGSRILPMLNVGLHFDDCPRSNGGLRVIPGTHHQGLFRLLFRKKYFIDHKADKREAGFDIEAGDLTVHDGRLWHRVQQSSLTGEGSRRRVMYFPIVTGTYQPKHAASATPFYHKLGRYNLNGAIKPKLTLLKSKLRYNFLKRELD